MPRSPDIRKLARRQRWLQWIFLTSIVLAVLSSVAPGQYGVILKPAWIAFCILTWVGLVRVMLVDGTHPITIVLSSIFMMTSPQLVILPVFLLVSIGAVYKLHQAGLHQGFMGVDPEEVERILNVALCTKCGYSLRGLTENRCPECFTEFDPADVPKD